MISSPSFSSTLTTSPSPSKLSLTRMVHSKPKWPNPEASLGEEFTPMKQTFPLKIRRRWDARGPALAAFLEVSDEFRRFKEQRDDIGELETKTPVWGWTCCMVGKDFLDARPAVTVHCHSKALCEKIIREVQETEWWKEFICKYPAFSFIISNVAPRPILLGDDGEYGEMLEEILQDVPDLVMDIPPNEEEEAIALHLIADSIMQQRQMANRALIFHPLNFSIFLAIATGITLARVSRSNLMLIAAGVPGAMIAMLLTVEMVLWAYSTLVEKVRNNRWLDEIKGDGYQVIVARFDGEIIGVLVLNLRPVIVDEDSERSKADADVRGMRGLIRAWTVKHKYRGQGVGTNLLEEAFRRCQELDAEDLSFMDNHANSTKVFWPRFNKYFDESDKRARKQLEKVKAEFGRNAKNSQRGKPDQRRLTNPPNEPLKSADHQGMLSPPPTKEIDSLKSAFRQGAATDASKQARGDADDLSGIEQGRHDEHSGPKHQIQPGGEHCGQHVTFVFEGGSNQRRAAIGGVILVGGIPYGLTVAHAISTNAVQEIPVLASDTSVADDCSFENVEFVDDSDEEGIVQEDLQSITSQGSVSSHDSNDSIVTSGSSTSGPGFSSNPGQEMQLGSNDSPSQDKDDLVSTNFDPDPSIDAASLRQSSKLILSDELDWALVPPEYWTTQKDFKLYNTVPCYLSNSDQCGIESIAEPPSTSTSIVAITSSKSFVTGTLSAAPFLLKVPGGNKFVKTYSVRLDQPISPGDCGTWVVDSVTGQFYGHIIAGQAPFLTTFIISAWDIKEDIERRLGSTVSLPDPNVRKIPKLRNPTLGSAMTNARDWGLTCSICTDVLYQPLTLLNCLHAFCGSCLKEWFSSQALRSADGDNPATCPQCRAVVREALPDARVTTLLEMFLQANPGQVREQADKDELAKIYKPGDKILPKTQTSLVPGPSSVSQVTEQSLSTPAARPKGDSEPLPRLAAPNDPISDKTICSSATSPNHDHIRTQHTKKQNSQDISPPPNIQNKEEAVEDRRLHPKSQKPPHKSRNFDIHLDFGLLGRGSKKSENGTQSSRDNSSPIIEIQPRRSHHRIVVENHALPSPPSPTLHAHRRDSSNQVIILESDGRRTRHRELEYEATGRSRQAEKMAQQIRLQLDRERNEAADRERRAREEHEHMRRLQRQVEESRVEIEALRRVDVERERRERERLADMATQMRERMEIERREADRLRDGRKRMEIERQEAERLRIEREMERREEGEREHREMTERMIRRWDSPRIVQERAESVKERGNRMTREALEMTRRRRGSPGPGMDRVIWEDDRKRMGGRWD